MMIDRYDAVLLLGFALVLFSAGRLAGWPAVVGVIGVALIAIGAIGASNTGDPNGD